MIRFLACVIACWWGVGCSKNTQPQQAPEPQAAPSRHVGTTSCASCHQTEYQQWMGSHHQLAMQQANANTVLADFNDATFVEQGVTNRFFVDEGEYFVEAEGPEGQMQVFPIKYTFGIYPLQQYVVAMGKGRYQVLTTCWDTRPKEEGGQRWYGLYDGIETERIHHYDELHWTSANFNWNYMCAECHTTEFRKNYNPANRSYATTYKEINVACEACHGPGDRHVAWANNPAGVDIDEHKGLVPLRELTPAVWLLDAETGKAKRSSPLASDIQLETCAPCHARREKLAEPTMPGVPLFDQVGPNVLESHLYHHDGQIKDEVYVYGSFTQSKMHHAGVRCTDCHNPHSLELKLPGNALCAQCHHSDRYDTPTHHFHEAGAPGSQCVDCHMPQTTYMGVDARRDHQFHIPNPALSLKTGVPNACTKCHTTENDEWAAEYTRKWYPHQKPGTDHFASLFARAAEGDPSVADGLNRLVSDSSQADIVRATALWHLQYLPGHHDNSIAQGLKDEHPLVRQMAVRLSARLGAQARVNRVGSALEDDTLSVRLEAVQQLVGTHKDLLGYALSQSFDEAKAEYLSAQSVVEDRAVGEMRRGMVHAAEHHMAAAKAAYRQAILTEPRSMPPRINLAEHLYLEGEKSEALALLEEGIQLRPNSPVVHEAFGRMLIREKQYEAGLAQIKKSLDIYGDHASLQYFYGVGMFQMGHPERALEALKKAVSLAPYNEEFLTGSVALCIEYRQPDAAKFFIARLQEAYPEDPRYRRMLEGGNL